MPTSDRVTFTPSPQNRKYLAQLRRLGVYGKRNGDILNAVSRHMGDTMKL